MSWEHPPEDRYALSPIQHGMLFHHLLGRGSGVDIEQITIDLHEAVDVRALEAAWRAVIQRHPVLRTAFVWEGVAEPVQQVYREIPFLLDVRDWRNRNREEARRNFQECLASQRGEGFDLRRPPLLRVTVFHFGDAEYKLLWTFHHILIDGRSFTIILDEVFRYYEAIREGRELHLAKAAPYAEYIRWLEQVDFSAAGDFWRSNLRGFAAPTPLIFDKVPATSAGKERYGECELRLSRQSSEALKSWAGKEEITLNTAVMGAWGLLMSRYSGEDDVVFGATKTTRRSSIPGADSMVGLFLATIPVRLRIDAEMPVGEWLRQLRRQWLSLRDFEQLSLVKIRETSELPAGQSLFETLVVFDNQRFDSALKALGPAWQKREMQLLEQTNFELTLIAYGDSEILLKLEYNSTRFQRSTVQRALGHLQTLLEQMAVDSDAPVGNLNPLTAGERQQLLGNWNATQTEYPRERCVQELIEEQAAATPDRIAAISGEERLTYRELNERANQVAHYLTQLGAGPERLVGICMERTAELLVALLGILKSGAAYVPMDPIYPPERLAMMAEDAGLEIVVTQEMLRGSVASFGGRRVLLDAERQEIGRQSRENPGRRSGPENLAYVIFTSGSTGRPKGVQVVQRALVNFLLSMQREPGLSAEDVLLAVTTISFDIAGLELYLPLIVGARVVVASRRAVADARELMRLLGEGVTVMQATPATWRLLLEAGWAGKRDLKVLCGGEAMPAEVAEGLLERVGSLWNMYGPTETTIWSTLERVEKGKEITIGRPIANTEIYILDRWLKPVPVGVVGELHIGGEGLARGYWKREELTAEKFIGHPFRQQEGERIYKTGDLARYRADGRIECLGRIDHQVKIRGFRIELGEIESLLAEYAGVKQALVTVREDVPGDKRLVAYVVAEGGLSRTELRAHLKQRLPEYMVPAHYVELEAMPLLANGKVNRHALPAPEQEAGVTAEGNYLEPTTELERELAEIWAEVLRIPKVGAHDDFFELGGHSLLAVQLFARMEDRLGAKLPLNALFETPTLREMASRLKKVAAAARHRAVAIQKNGTNAPLFWIPGGAAVSLLAFREVSLLLGREQPVYGLESAWPRLGEEPESIEERAMRYIEQIRQIQASGPYYLAGYCLGAKVAYEMARQLEAEGEQMGLLAIVNAAAPGHPRTRAQAWQIHAQRTAYLFRRAAGAGATKLPGYVLGRLANLRQARRARAALEQRRKAAEALVQSGVEIMAKADDELVLTMMARVADRYVPGPYGGRIEVFLATEDQHLMGVKEAVDPRFGWQELAPGRCSFHHIPGDHLSVFERPNAEVFAGHLRACLQQTAACSNALP